MCEKCVLIHKEELTPHHVVYLCYSGKISERVTRVFFKSVLLVTRHKSYSDTVCQLGQKCYHFVVLVHRKLAHSRKAKLLAKLFSYLDRIGSIFLGRGNDIVSTREHLVVAVFNSASLSSRHRVSRNKLNVGTKRTLYLIYHASLYTRNVGYDSAGGEKMLIFLYPFHEDCRIECKNYKLGSCNKVFIKLGSSKVYHSLFKCVIYVLLLLGYAFYRITLFRKSHSIASADKSKTYYKNFSVFIELHTRTSIPRSRMSSKKVGKLFEIASAPSISPPVRVRRTASDITIRWSPCPKSFSFGLWKSRG